jgi:competence protein ComEA
MEALPRIGPTKAQDIVAYREEHGPFQRIEEIQNVSGIGPGIFSSIEPYITAGP